MPGPPKIIQPKIGVAPADNVVVMVAFAVGVTVVVWAEAMAKIEARTRY